jgi:hypothetical protein
MFTYIKYTGRVTNDHQVKETLYIKILTADSSVSEC